MGSQDARAAAIWKQKAIPVVYRAGSGIPLMIKLPYADDNFIWLRGYNHRKPDWDKQYKCWEVPSTWFEYVTRLILNRYDRVYVIQPYRALEKCAPACWNAKGLECECSCMGENHGSQAGGRWYIVSETCALQWHNRELACRLFEKPLPGGVTRRPISSIPPN